MNIDYTRVPGLKNIYLKDSWLLKIDERPAQISFTLDAVLTPQHPEYVPPIPGEQYCYRRALLQFTNLVHITWLNKKTDQPAYDATGTPDYGSIDVLGITKNGYHLKGDFGVLELTTKTPPTCIILES